MTTKTAAALLLLSAAGVHGQTAAFDPAETCEGKAEGAECWHQLDSHPGCYVWNNGHLDAEQTASWSGACNGSVAEGDGVLTSGSGTVAEGTYAAGHRAGRWRFTAGDGTEEGIFANGRRAGRWVARGANGTVGEVPYVNGKKHGTVVARNANGDVIETPWVNGKEHGTVVLRMANGDVIRYVNGKRQDP